MTKTFLFSAIILLLTSCATYKALDKSMLEGKVPNNETFIRLKTGEVIKGEHISFAKDPGPSAHREKRKGCWYSWDDWIGIDNKKFKRDSICGYQEGDINYIYYGCNKARMLRYGKLNLYTYESMLDIHNSLTMFVFQKGSDECNPGLIYKDLHEFYQAISDNPEAANLCNKLFPNLKRYQTDVSLRNILAVVDKYNE
jgi:hypothetical protein